MNILGLISQLIGIKTLRLTEVINSNTTILKTYFFEIFMPSIPCNADGAKPRGTSNFVHDTLLWSRGTNQTNH